MRIEACLVARRSTSAAVIGDIETWASASEDASFMPRPTIMSAAVSGCGAELRLGLGKGPPDQSVALIDHVLGLSAIG